jgi:hypothetical protein
MSTFPSPSQVIKCQDLASCFQAIYNFLFAIFVAMAFLYFLFGAFEYLISGAGIYKKESGKSRMINAITALIIVLVLPVILNMINPHIFEAKLQIPKVTVTTPGSEYRGEDHTAPSPPGPPKAGFVTIGRLGLKCIKGRNDVQISETIVDKIRTLDDNLCKLGVDAIITSGLRSGYGSNCHTVYGTCIDIIPANDNGLPVGAHCREWKNLGQALQGIGNFIYETNEGTCKDNKVLTDNDPCCIINEKYCDGIKEWHKCLQSKGFHIHANLKK